jgi:choline dehydrogenase-like flavoprotein
VASAERFDLAVIGSGPGGYVAAIRAAQLGRRVAVIEEDRPGGVCLNWGCIPSKALLTGASLVETLRDHGETFGVVAGELRLDYGKAIDHSRKVADRLCKGVQGLFKKNSPGAERSPGAAASRCAAPWSAWSRRTSCCSRRAPPSGRRRACRWTASACSPPARPSNRSACRSAWW